MLAERIKLQHLFRLAEDRERHALGRLSLLAVVDWWTELQLSWRRRANEYHLACLGRVASPQKQGSVTGAVNAKNDRVRSVHRAKDPAAQRAGGAGRDNGTKRAQLRQGQELDGNHGADQSEHRLTRRRAEAVLASLSLVVAARDQGSQPTHFLDEPHGRPRHARDVQGR